MDILERTSMADCKPCATPVDTHIKASFDDGAPVADPTDYRSLSGLSGTSSSPARHRLRRPAGVPPHAQPLGAAPHRYEADLAVSSGYPRLQPSSPARDHRALGLH
jgi:hypothetical protein